MNYIDESIRPVTWIEQKRYEEAGGVIYNAIFLVPSCSTWTVNRIGVWTDLTPEGASTGWHYIDSAVFIVGILHNP